MNMANLSFKERFVLPKYDDPGEIQARSGNHRTGKMHRVFIVFTGLSFQGPVSGK